MIIEEIKKANIEAMRNKEHNLRNIYSIIINKHMQLVIEKRAKNEQVSDDDTIKIIQKTIKELTEEAQNYKKVGNTEQEKKIEEQKQVLSAYLPKMLSQSEVIEIIQGLDDKSIPTVMRYFKTNYGSGVDLGMVSKVLRSL